MTRADQDRDTDPRRTDERRTDTRAQIRAVALELFAEQGYEKTSLREIAERLGVTKAAVYYHFRTKEEILAGLLDGVVEGIDEILAWGHAQPPGPGRTRAVLQRYHDLLSGPKGPTPDLIRFLQESGASLKDLASAAQMRERFEGLSTLLCGPDEPVDRRLRARLALIALHLGAFAVDGPGRPGSTDEPAPGDGLDPAADAERRAAALRIAEELAGSGPAT